MGNIIRVGFKQPTKFRSPSGTVLMVGRLFAQLKLPGDDRIYDLGLLGEKCVTRAFISPLSLGLSAGATSNLVTGFKYHGSGIVGDGTAEASTQTALESEIAVTRATGSQANADSGDDYTYTTIGTQLYDGVYLVNEHAVFNAITSGIMLDRTALSTETDIPVTDGASIKWTYVLTMTAGG